MLHPRPTREQLTSCVATHHLDRLAIWCSKPQAEDWILNGQVFKGLGYSFSHRYGPYHSKTGLFKSRTFFSRFQMVFDKMAAIFLDFKWLGFWISDPHCSHFSMIVSCAQILVTSFVNFLDPCYLCLSGLPVFVKLLNVLKYLIFLKI